jgi:dTDP-4-amino-4,6-dideoxygalactose transaminase
MTKLAILGGEPVRKKPFSKWPKFSEKEIDALKRVVKSGIWVWGEMKKEFESKFATYQNAKYGVSVTSGTTALEVALRAVGINSGDEVIMPAYTFMATAAAAIQVNALPVFVDIDPSTYTIDTELIEKFITEKTKVIIPVHIAGHPANMDKIIKISKENNIKIVEDACQAWGAEWRGRRVGAIGDLGAFSFQSSKHITSGEGGIITTNSRKLYELCWSYHNCGRNIGGARYQHNLLGFNYRMTEFQAAVLLAQFSRLDDQTKKRNENALYLSKELLKIKGIEPLERNKNVTRHAYHLYIIKYHKEEFDGLPRSKFLNALNAEGIPCSQGYVPLYKEKFIRNLANDTYLSHIYGERSIYSGINLKETEKACNKECVWIGHQNMLLDKKEDMDDIVNSIIKIKDNVKKLTK